MCPSPQPLEKGSYSSSGYLCQLKSGIIKDVHSCTAGYNAMSLIRSEAWEAGDIWFVLLNFIGAPEKMAALED